MKRIGGDTSDVVRERGALFGNGMRVALPGTAAGRQEAMDDAKGETLASCIDGLSNTAMFSEVLQTASDTNHSATYSDFRGAPYRGENAFFSTYYEPNTKNPDEMMVSSYCHAPGNDVTKGAPCIAGECTVRLCDSHLGSQLPPRRRQRLPRRRERWLLCQHDQPNCLAWFRELARWRSVEPRPIRVDSNHDDASSIRLTGARLVSRLGELFPFGIP